MIVLLLCCCDFHFDFDEYAHVTQPTDGRSTWRRMTPQCSWLWKGEAVTGMNVIFVAICKGSHTMHVEPVKIATQTHTQAHARVCKCILAYKHKCFCASMCVHFFICLPAAVSWIVCLSAINTLFIKRLTFHRTHTHTHSSLHPVLPLILPNPPICCCYSFHYIAFHIVVFDIYALRQWHLKNRIARQDAKRASEPTN